MKPLGGAGDGLTSEAQQYRHTDLDGGSMLRGAAGSPACRRLMW